MQGYTSSATSINRVKLPAVYSKVTLSAPVVLDYGCGKYIDHIRTSIPDGIKYLPFDPFNQSDDVNRTTKNAVRDAISNGNQVDVVCSNVLNVIDDDETVQDIAHTIEMIVTCSGGKGYVTVYDGNRSGIGRKTGNDQYQRNDPLRNYLRFFRNAVIRNGVIVIGA